MDHLVDIYTIEENISINDQDYIVNVSLDLDVDVTQDDETLEFTLNAENIEEDVNLQAPSDDETVTEEELEKIIQDELGDEDVEIEKPEEFPAE